MEDTIVVTKDYGSIYDEVKKLYNSNDKIIGELINEIYETSNIEESTHHDFLQFYVQYGIFHIIKTISNLTINCQGIFKACEAGNLNRVKYFIERKHININITDINSGKTLLHFAILNNHADVCVYLIANGAKLEKKDMCGKSILQLACQVGDYDIVKSIFSQCPNIYEKDHSGKTALHYACQSGNFSIVELLVSNGFDIEEKDETEQSPLHYACKEDNLQIVEYLIEKGSNIEEIDYFGNRPLHFASYHGNTGIVRYLLSKGANKEVKNNDDDIPYDEADNIEIRKLLK